MKTTYALLVAAVLTLAAGPVLAEEAAPAADKAVAAEAEAVPVAAPDFATLDANADGSLSKEELTTGFDEKDADKDGKVTKEEFEK